ncbi:hypothetical protein PS2_002641 [Malus domestica]
MDSHLKKRAKEAYIYDPSPKPKRVEQISNEELNALVEEFILNQKRRQRLREVEQDSAFDKLEGSGKQKG